MRKFFGAKRKRQAASLLLAAVLTVGTVSGTGTLPVNAEESTAAYSGGLCEHHTEHTEDCGYTEAVEGSSCAHVHTEECYESITDCVHEHTEACYPEGSVSGNAAISSDENKPAACTHVCSETSGCMTKELNCQHEHDESCGYKEAQPGTPCGYVCEICAGSSVSGDPADSGQEPQCSCETLCTEGNVNADCPVCGADGADLDQCAGNEQEDKVKQVQDMINALPTVDELKAMTQEEQSAVYADLQTAYDAYEVLSDDEKQEVTGAEIFDNLFAVFNGMMDALDDSGFTVNGGVSGVDYELSGNTLTISSRTPLTISTTGSDAITGQIVISENVSADLTLNGVNIKGTTPDGALSTSATSAIDLSTGSSLTLTLAQGSTNTLTGGAGGTSGVKGAPAIHVPEGRTLTVLCENQSDSGHICSSNCGSLSATGGSASTDSGGVGIGGGIQAGVAGNTTSESCGTVLLLGGISKLTAVRVTAIEQPKTSAAPMAAPLAEQVARLSS